MDSEKWARNSFDVDAVLVTEDNMEEVSKWCQGDIILVDSEKGEASGNRYIKVRVNNPMTERQTRAFPGDWVLYAHNGFKVYTEKAFKGSFHKLETTTNVFETTVGGGGGGTAV